MRYIAIDGDDIGRRLTSYYLNNDASGLQQFSRRLSDIIRSMEALLTSRGFTVVFCAADGVSAYSEQTSELSALFDELRALSSERISFSAGVGASLRDAYIALLAAKASGKNQLVHFDDLPRDR